MKKYMFPVKIAILVYIPKIYAYPLSFLSVKIGYNEGFLKSGRYPVLTVLSAGHALHVFINGRLSGGQHVFLDIDGTFETNI